MFLPGSSAFTPDRGIHQPALPGVRIHTHRSVRTVMTLLFPQRRPSLKYEFIAGSSQTAPALWVWIILHFQKAFFVVVLNTQAKGELKLEEPSGIFPYYLWIALCFRRVRFSHLKMSFYFLKICAQEWIFKDKWSIPGTRGGQGTWPGSINKNLGSELRLHRRAYRLPLFWFVNQKTLEKWRN